MRFTYRFFIIQSKKLNYQYENDFTQGFCDNAPEGYNFEADCDASCPWCFPYYADPSLVLYGETAYDAGAKWAKHVYNDLKEAIENESNYTD